MTPAPGPRGTSEARKKKGLLQTPSGAKFFWAWASKSKRSSPPPRVGSRYKLSFDPLEVAGPSRFPVARGVQPVEVS